MQKRSERKTARRARGPLKFLQEAALATWVASTPGPAAGDGTVSQQTALEVKGLADKRRFPFSDET